MERKIIQKKYVRYIEIAEVTWRGTGATVSPLFLDSNNFLSTWNVQSRLAITSPMGSMQKIRYSEEGFESFRARNTEWPSPKQTVIRYKPTIK